MQFFRHARVPGALSAQVMTISSRKLRRSLGFLHEVIEHGESVEITHYGRPWAALVPWRVATPLLAGQSWWLSRSADSLPADPPISYTEWWQRQPLEERAGEFLGLRARRGPRDLGEKHIKGNRFRCIAPSSHYVVDRTVFEQIELGNRSALKAIDSATSLAIAPFTYMQMATAVTCRRNLFLFKQFLARFGFAYLELDSAVTHRAITMMELLGGFSHRTAGISPEESLLAATAFATNRTVLTMEPERLVQVPNLMLAVVGENGAEPAAPREGQWVDPGGEVFPRIERLWGQYATRPH